MGGTNSAWSGRAAGGTGRGSSRPVGRSFGRRSAAGQGLPDRELVAFGVAEDAVL